MKKVIQSIKEVLIKLVKNPFQLFGIIIATPGFLVVIHTIRSDMPYDERTYYVLLGTITVCIGWYLVRFRPGDDEETDEESIRKQLLELPIEERRKILTEQANDPEIIKYYEELGKDGEI